MTYLSQLILAPCTLTPHTEGIAAINKMMEDTGTDTLLKIFISNLTHQVLTKNYFKLNDKLYEQIQETAMGIKIVSNYAIIFMHLLNYSKQPKIWLTFIDDIFMIWKDRKLELEKFLEAFNSHHPPIQFTHTMDENKIPFLDTVVYRSPTKRIYTRIFHKPTDQKHYSHYHSAHQKTKRILSLMAF